MSKSGFSTLNRWLGKKNKDKTNAPNGKLSKSSTNLSISSTNLSDASQLEYNRIAPLPAITSNAPFEQTFRITVLLPKDQLYVARLGARVPLSKLLELVCDHKSLDAQKYEFRNPVDPSQIYNCDLTIGAVGLSEIRLCHKSDSYDNYNGDDVIKLHRTSVIRDSLSSSEFSSRNSKHTTKTASPYSSSNSLNSMDSTGVNYTRTPITAPPPALPKSTPPPKVAAPPRKKRAAPRPPSQIVIPEKDALVIDQEANQTEQTIEALKQQQETMTTTMRRDFFSSTPNLRAGDCNGNGNISPSPSSKTNLLANGNSEDESTQVAQKNARNLHSVSVQNLTVESPNEEAKKLPEPSPRKRLVQLKKKSAPAPPPRCSSVVSEDAISLASTTYSTPDTPDTPNTADSDKFEKLSMSFQAHHSTVENGQQQPSSVTREPAAPAKQLAQSSTPVSGTKTVEVDKETISLATKVVTPPPNLPKPSPRQTTTTLLNASPPPASPIITQRSNVSKVLLNRTPTPEPRSLSCEPNEGDCDDDNDSKQADSGIGEPVPSPIPDSLPSEGSAHECKSTFESSSDDDEIIKTYNFKLGKTTVKPILEEHTPKTLEELKALQLNSDEVTPATPTHEPTPNAAETASWNFSIPISPPPNFADNVQQTQSTDQVNTDKPITPKIVERPVLNFDSLTTTTTKATAATSANVVDHSCLKQQTSIERSLPRTPLPSPSTPINEIIDELSNILNEKRMDTLIKKHDEQSEIESAKPNTLSNFSITTLATQQSSRPVGVFNEQETISEKVERTTASSITEDDEKLYRKRGSLTNGSAVLKQRKSNVNRADSFHISRQNSTQGESTNGLNSRSASYLSLTKLEQNGSLGQRRSSSELSIAESPSLISLEIIKTILNSRKNSLTNSSDGEGNKSPSVEVVNIERRTTTEEIKITSVEMKPKQVEQAAAQEEAVVVAVKPKEELPKTYRYSGPPSINFSTWSERPKVQVAIKNEGDYIFGGKNASNQNAAVTHADVEIRSTAKVPRNQRATMPASAFRETTPPIMAPKPNLGTTDRMGIPEKDYRVPVTVRPLKDVTVESAVTSESTTTATNPKRQFNQMSSTSTLPRTGNRFSMPPKPVTPGPALLRSTSITQLDAQQQQKVDKNESTTGAAPFGQNTLRRTGLKEKILAKEEQAQKQQQQPATASATQKSTQNTNVSVTTTTTKVNSIAHINGGTAASFPKNTPQMPFQTSTKILQSAKLELKLHPNFGQIKSNGLKSPTTTKASTPQSAPPAAPPMPVLKSVALRSKSSGSATTPTNGDARDALLEAIKNFKRDGLNRI